MPWKIPLHIPLPESFKGFDPTSSTSPTHFTRYERHLPHWRLPGACYFTTFRLDDSIPVAVLLEMRREAHQWDHQLKEWQSANNGSLTAAQAQAWHTFQRNRRRKLENLLDDGHGECLLRETNLRRIVEEALLHFEGTRCEMLAYAVMPNHVHALCRPLGSFTIESLCASWKWFTAKKIQCVQQRTGPLWQAESFDRIIRDGDHYAATVRYIAKNPINARMNENEASVWFCERIRQANDWTGES